MDVKTAALLSKDIINEYWRVTELSEIDASDNEDVSLVHAVWMLNGIILGYIQNDKAHRWLGYVQGIMACHNVATVKQMKEVNKRATQTM